MIFNQSATLKVGSLEFNYPNFHMEWSYKVENDNSPSILEITVFNLSDTNINSVKINQACVFQFGYNGDIGVLCEGYVKQLETEKGVDKQTKITILEANLKYNTQIVVGYAKNTTASYILKDICGNNGFYIKKLDLITDFRFETGYSAKGNILDIIKKIVGKTGSKITIKDKNIYIYTDNSAKEGNIILDYTSGLLKEPKKCVDSDKKYDYSVEALPIYYLKKGDIFNLKANDLKGNMRIKSFEINDWVAVYYVGEVK